MTELILQLSLGMFTILGIALFVAIPIRYFYILLNESV